MTSLAKATGQYTETTIDDEIVVMNLESGDFFSLTGTARAIWQQLDRHQDRDRLVAAIADEFGADPAMVGADVDAFLVQLADAGLLAAS